MSRDTVISIDRSKVLELSRTKQEPQWVTALREEGLALAETLDLPKLEKTRIDRWNLELSSSYQEPVKLASLEEVPDVMKNWVHPDNILVHRNSGAVFKHVAGEIAEQGVIFTDLDSAIQDCPELVEPYFMQAVKAEENLLTAMHSALWSGGVFIYVPKNVQLEIPLQAMFIVDENGAGFIPHVLIVADEYSSVTYVENRVSSARGTTPVQNAVVEVFVKSGAKVNVVSVHSLEPSVTDVTYRRAIVEEHGAIQWVTGEMNTGNTMCDTTSILKGNGADSDAKVIYVGTEDQKMNLTTRAVHFGKSTTSNMITRAVMRDQSTAIINGITKIEKGASGTNGQQTEKVLMLSPQARGDANPILLIDEDDVQAGHAASVGQVNPEQMYYLMSRGISRKEAERLIVYGFLAPVVSEVPLPKSAEQLQILVERKLGQRQQ